MLSLLMAAIHNSSLLYAGLMQSYDAGAGGAVTGRHLVISLLSSPLSDIRNAIFIAKIN